MTKEKLKLSEEEKKTFVSIMKNKIENFEKDICPENYEIKKMEIVIEHIETKKEDVIIKYENIKYENKGNKDAKK